MSAAIAKIKDLVQTFGLTAEHLGLTAARGKTSSAKKSKSKPKQSGAGKIKYADPKTGKTWSGFGRAPAWIAAAKNRDAFLVDKSDVVISKAPAASKKVAKSASKVAKPSAKKTARATAAVAPTTAAKKPAAKKAGAKVKAKKSASKKVASRGAATAVKPEPTSSASE